jgi:hypothetical protein
MKFNHRIIDIIALIKNNNINAEFNKVNSVVIYAAVVTVGLTNVVIVPVTISAG